MHEAEKALVDLGARFDIARGRILLYIKHNQLYTTEDKPQSFKAYIEANHLRFGFKGAMANHLIRAFQVAESLEHITKPGNERQANILFAHFIHNTLTSTGMVARACHGSQGNNEASWFGYA